MSKHKSFAAVFAVGVLAAALASPVISASLSQLSSSPNYSEASQIVPTINGVINSINAGITAQSMAPNNTPRNLLDNGSMAMAQRGTSAITCAQNSGVASANYTADRWACSANVASGAGRGQVVTASPSPNVAFQNSLNLWRLSGALTQPVCAIQEVSTARSTQAAGTSVIFSVWAQALAGLSADNGNAANLYIFTGTGSDEGLGSFTASPAITPAWTGIATTGSKAITLTTSWARYNSGVVAIPLGTTEIGVAICFTPTASGAGATDGLSFVGGQLEIVGPNSTSPSVYEFKQNEANELYRYFYRWNEATIYASVSSQAVPLGACSAVDTTHTNCWLQFPSVMRTKATMAYTAGFASPTSTTQATLGACSALATAQTVSGALPSTTGALVNCTATTIPAAGVASFLYASSGSGIISASADF